jgi:hypothetical protein
MLLPSVRRASVCTSRSRSRSLACSQSRSLRDRLLCDRGYLACLCGLRAPRWDDISISKSDS